jgi:hypothetical protein
MNEEGYIHLSNFSDSLSLCVAPAHGLVSEKEHLTPRCLSGFLRRGTGCFPAIPRRPVQLG